MLETPAYRQRLAKCWIGVEETASGRAPTASMNRLRKQRNEAQSAMSEISRSLNPTALSATMSACVILLGVAGDLLGIGEHRHVLFIEAGAAEIALHGRRLFLRAEICNQLLAVDIGAIGARHLLAATRVINRQALRPSEKLPRAV